MEKNVLNVAVFTAIIRKLVRNTIVKNGKHAPNAALVVLFILRLVPNISLVIKNVTNAEDRTGTKNGVLNMMKQRYLYALNVVGNEDFIKQTARKVRDAVQFVAMVYKAEGIKLGAIILQVIIS